MADREDEATLWHPDELVASQAEIIITSHFEARSREVEKLRQAAAVDAAKRGVLRSGSHLIELRDIATKVLEETASAVSDQLLRLVDSHSVLDRRSGAWILARVSRFVDGGMTSIARREQDDRRRMSQPDTKTLDLTREAEAVISRLARRIEWAVNEAELRRRKTAEPSAAGIPSGQTPVSYADDDARVIEALSRLSPTAAAMYEQTLRDLSSERSSWSGVVADAREALRIALDSLAPDDIVTAQDWYKQVEGTSGPTRAQKAICALRRRGEESKRVTANLTATLARAEEEFGDWVASTYNRGSRSTHTGTSREEASRIQALVKAVLRDLLVECTIDFDSTEWDHGECHATILCSSRPAADSLWRRGPVPGRREQMTLAAQG